MNYTDLATTVTQQLIAQIETGPGTWRMPWYTIPGVFDVRNASTSNRYRGANTVSLALQAIEAEHPTGCGRPTGNGPTSAPKSARANDRPRS